MGDALEPLLATNPAAFMAVVNNHDADERVRSLHTLDDLVACEALRHGIFNDPVGLSALVGFYRKSFMQAPVDRRKQIYDHVALIVPQLGGWTAGAFTPFMLVDTDMGIVSTATIDYASLGTLLDDDPMTRPRDVVAMVKGGVPANPGAVIGGLLALGDPRVCDIVRPLRKKLDAEPITIATRCFSGFTARCTVEFYLDWLDELVGRRDPDGQGMFGHVVGGLCRLAEGRSVPYVLNCLRPFPIPPVGENLGWQSIGGIDPVDFASAIADRLYDLEQREVAPKIMPHAISAFGLVPKTPLDLVARVQ